MQKEFAKKSPDLAGELQPGWGKSSSKSGIGWIWRLWRAVCDAEGLWEMSGRGSVAGRMQLGVGAWRVLKKTVNWARDFSKFDEVVHFAVFPSDKNMFSWMGIIIESYSGKKLQILVGGLPCGSKAGSQQLRPKFVVFSLACGPYQIYCITT